MEKIFKTRVKEGAAQVTTKATIDWSGVTEAEMQQLASATVIINEQAIYRASGTIPEVATINVRAQLDAPRGGGFKVTPENLADRISKLSDEDYATSLTKLGLSEKQVAAMVKARAK